MKKTKNRIATFFILTFAAFAFTACSKDDGADGPNLNGTEQHKIVFKAETSAGATISHLLYGYDNSMTSVSGLSNATWVSPEVSVPANANMANFSVNGVGANANSTLKVQIFVDGILKKEETKTGTILAAQAQYNLR